MFLIFALISISGCYREYCGNYICAGSETHENCPEDCAEPECTETDDGFDPDNKGITSILEGDEEEDYCYNSTHLVEYSCEFDDIRETTWLCDDENESTTDSCLGGQCVYDEVQIGCEDSDDMDFFNKGTVNFEGEEWEDYCTNSNELKEYYCDRFDIMGQTSQDCADFDAVCNAGACVLYTEICESDEVEEDPSIEIRVAGEESKTIKDSSGITMTFESGDINNPQAFVLDLAKSNVIFSTENFNMFDLDSLNKRNAYIVELENEPLVKTLANFNNQVQSIQSSKKDLSSVNMQISQASVDFDAAMARQENAIVSQQNSVLSRMAQKDIIPSIRSVKEKYKNSFSGFLIDAKKEDIEEIKKIPGVKSVHPDYEVNAYLDVSVPLIGADDVWNEVIDENGQRVDGTGITIGIIDTGVDYNHPDLGGCIGANCKVIDGYDFVNGDDDPMDDQGHGTHVAATAAGNGVLKGVAPGAQIYAYKVLSAEGNGSASNIISAIERSMDPNQDGDLTDHLDIISLSLGRPFGSTTDPDVVAITNVVNAGIVATISAGNSGLFYSVGCPGCAPEAITIAAINDTKGLAGFSSRGPGVTEFVLKPDIGAPGVEICAAQAADDKIWQTYMGGRDIDIHCIDDTHMQISGTSMAAPHAAGLAALMLQKNPNLSPLQVKAQMMQTAEKLEPELLILESGTGLIDAKKAVTAKTRVLPPLVELTADEGIQDQFTLEFQNDDLTRKGFKVSYDKGYLYPPTDDSNNNPYLLDIETKTICVNENSKNNLDFVMTKSNGTSLLNLNYGFYYGDIVVEQYDDCDFLSNPENEFMIPYSVNNVRTIKIDVSTQNFDFESYERYTLFYYFTEDGVSSDLFSINPSTTNYEISFSVMSDAPVTWYYFTMFVGRTTTGYEFKYFFDGGKIDGENDLINEQGLPLLESNFDEVAQRFGLGHRMEQKIFLELKEGIGRISFDVSDYSRCNDMLGEDGIYINKDAFEIIKLSQKYTEKYKLMLESNIIASLYKEQNTSNMTDNYIETNAQDYQKGTISMYDSFGDAGSKGLFGWELQEPNSNMVAVSTYVYDSLPIEDLPKTIDFYYIPESSHLFLANILDSSDDEYLKQEYVFGTVFYTKQYPEIGSIPVEFFKDPHTIDMFARWWNTNAGIKFNGADEYAGVPNELLYGSILPYSPWERFLDKYSYKVVSPSGTGYEGMGAPNFDSWYQYARNPQMDIPEIGVYQVFFNGSKVINQEPKTFTGEVCYDGEIWYIDKDIFPDECQ